MKVTVIASGSKGNSLVVDFGRTRIAVDAGFGSRTLAQRYHAAGIAPESVQTCVVTHEHTDHAQGALAARKKWRWTVAATQPTLAAIDAPMTAPHIAPVSYGDPTTFGDARVTLIQVSHDAVAPAAVLVEDSVSGARIGIAYDLGVVPEELTRVFSNLDVLILEANHDLGMLRAGPYPPYLQERISSAQGHLSNFQSAEFARHVAHPGLKAVVLAHLSEQNNTPESALNAVGRQLKRMSFKGKLVAANQRQSCAVGDTPEVQLRLL